MATLGQTFRRVDISLTRWAAKASVVFLRTSLGAVFLWFGALKLFPGLSPAQALAGKTIETLSFGLIGPDISLPMLALWECIIGIGLITGLFTRVTVLLLIMQMAGTMLPIFFFPAEIFTRFPYAPTLEGQYIIKNVVLIAGALVVGATVRGGRVIAHPDECNC
jgi:uncharacterized membrane protein YphA (DoxX/SURF4 family)